MARIRDLAKWKQSVLWVVVIAATVGFLLVVRLAINPTGNSVGRQELRISGLVTELQQGEDGALTALVIQTAVDEEIGILLTEETVSHLPDQPTATPASHAALRTDLLLSADCAQDETVLIRADGTQCAAYAARYLEVNGQLNRGAVALRDGTLLDVVESNNLITCRYRLADGTELLHVSAPSGPERVHVSGKESFDDLNETAQANVLAYYEQRGLLFDEQAELEKVYALYQTLGPDFRTGWLNQSVSLSASGERVIYFLTAVDLPAVRENEIVYNEVQLGDAFDRETGAHLDVWELFNVPRETVIKTILDANRDITDPALRAALESAPWDGRIVFFPDRLSVTFEPGILPGQTDAYGIGYDNRAGIQALMQDWAVPKSRN